MKQCCIHLTREGLGHSLGAAQDQSCMPEYRPVPWSSRILSENGGSVRTGLAYVDRPASFFF